MKSVLLLLLLAAPLAAQTNPHPCPGRTEMQAETTDTRALVLRMQSRIQMMRNYAGTVQNPEVRNALQVNADAWQDMIDLLNRNVGRLQTILDRCEAGEKIEKNKPK